LGDVVGWDRRQTGDAEDARGLLRCAHKVLWEAVLEWWRRLDRVADPQRGDNREGDNCGLRGSHKRESIPLRHEL
jgi:hypothetical protein